MDRIHSPEDLRALDGSELPLLCDELRGFLVTQVSRTGGHLASNLGVVELTVAIHRVFDTARDRLVFDVGHQCYVHKILTGRADRFPTLRQLGGISGFPKPCESVHDAFIAGHASNSVSVALGMARARTMLHEDYSVLALIGDGALTGGLAYEGLNNAGASGEPLIVILNDNGMSIDRNVGAMSEHLSRLRTKPEYFAFKKAYHNALSGSAAGRALYRFNHSLKTGLKKAMLPNATMFEDMGFAYLGPVDGHDLAQLTTALEWAREMKRPVLVHVRTQKGHGYAPAEREPWKFHGVGPFDAATGAVPPAKESFSSVFGAALTELAEEDPRVCAITAAMEDGTGLTPFAGRFPDRFFDVGIAEGHAAAMAAGLAKQGALPVCAVYSSFLQRAYDQLLHDVALSGLHVVFAVDRAGLVGADGATHHGVMDTVFLSGIPNMTVLCPASFAELRAMLRRALFEMTGPVAIRYPRGGEGAFTADTSAGHRPAHRGDPRRGGARAAEAHALQPRAQIHRAGERRRAVPPMRTGRGEPGTHGKGGLPMSTKERLDVALVARGLAETRAKAQASIMSGIVYVNGQKVDKAGTPVAADAALEVRGHTLRYVSRGGLKLEKAMAAFPITLTNCICADIGASTGGFTDCMLQNGAKKVYAVDVGYGQLDWRLRSDERVVCMERTNARYLTHEQIPDELDFASVDVSFISLKLILPALAGLLKPDGHAVCLVKPQFEAGREKVGKKGVVRDPAVHLEVLEHFLEHAKESRFTVLGLTYSPIRGPEGNIEYLGYLSRAEEEPPVHDLKALVEASHAALEEKKGENDA